MNFGADTSRGYMRATYDYRDSIRMIETFNGRGKRIVWTTFSGQTVETAYDMGEAGQATRWERSYPDSTGARIVRVEEALDPKTGKRVETARTSFNALQSVDQDGASCPISQETVDKATKESVEKIVKNFEGKSNCPGSESSLRMNDKKITFEGQGPVCLDSRCRNREGLGKLVKETVQEGAACLIKLGLDRLKDQGDSFAAVSTVPDGVTKENAALLQKSFALRNAGTLLMLFNQAPNFGVNWDSKEQYFAKDNGGAITNARTDDVRKKLGAFTAGPIKITCDLNPGGTINIKEDGKIEIDAHVGTQVLAQAAYPGSAGWPLIQVHADTGSRPTVSDKSTLFHEMMHMIGYAHDENPSGFRGVPVYTACQSCCFPGGQSSDDEWKPTDKFCGVESEKHKRICAMCAGDNGTTGKDASKAFTQFDEDMGSCHNVDTR